ncbi:MAG: hypothetical protein GX804_07690 [Lentisphaerae bacterium]|jgi:3D (Asp-Asp-Asp) domain-containing protein|nr:hypothetical protein [Lentisphaerota bacterium]
MHRILLVLEKIFTLIFFTAMLFILFLIEGCQTVQIRPDSGSRRRTVAMEITGYDSGPRSCGWKRDRFGRPVYAYGVNKGKPKKVGITASGTKAKRGTIAADTRYYPFGTIMYVPGYGYGRVEDRGGAIKGPHRLDLWFPTEREALLWGRKKNIRVTVWLPEKRK